MTVALRLQGATCSPVRCGAKGSQGARSCVQCATRPIKYLGLENHLWTSTADLGPVLVSKHSLATEKKYAEILFYIRFPCRLTLEHWC